MLLALAQGPCQTAAMTDAWVNTLTDFRRRKDAHFASGCGPNQGAALETLAGLIRIPVK